MLDELKRASEEKVNSKEKRLSSRMLNDGWKFKIFKYTFEKKFEFQFSTALSNTINSNVSSMEFHEIFLSLSYVANDRDTRNSEAMVLSFTFQWVENLSYV